FRIDRVPAISTQFYGMLTTSDVFRDKRVRQAFNYAIDRDKIVRYVLQGQAAGPAVHGIVPGSMPGYDTASIHGYSYDLAKARALMTEAGYPDGKGFPTVTIQLNSGGGRNELVAQSMQNMLSKGLGIKVEIRVLEWPQHQELLESGKAPLFRLGWNADYPDPDSFLNLFYSKTLPANPTDRSPINSTRFASARFDSLFELALGTLDDAARYKLYVQAEQVAVDEAPMLFIFHDLDFRLVQPYVRGYTSNPMDRRDFKATWFDMGQKPA
ncbi:MAG: ABC transporter substrate-binding protein, partial [Candidatus Kapaibacterium sp.]